MEKQTRRILFGSAVALVIVAVVVVAVAIALIWKGAKG